MARKICPFCLMPHDFEKSMECPIEKERIPDIYVRDYHKVAPMWLVTVGFSYHGKTTYLAALTLMLREITNVLPEVHYRPADQHTFDEIRKMQKEASTYKLPPATDKKKEKKLLRPLLFNVYNLPQVGSRCLVMYDVPGETYDSLSEVAGYARSIKQVNTTWFLVSLDDLHGDKQGRSITDLFHSYLYGMESLKADLKDRNLIVVYTKADKLTSPEIRKYLRSDPLQGLTKENYEHFQTNTFSFEDYIQDMRAMSDFLEKYTRDQVVGGRAFINTVKANGLSLVFCLSSALGQDPDAKSGYLIENPSRYRVFDPFFWAVILEQKPSDRSLGLVLDASQKSRSVYDDSLLQPLWDMLAGQGELTTYYLGQLSPTSRPGQTPPTGPPPDFRYRLIGPILKNAPVDSKIVVITTGRILDLADFYDTGWRDRLLLVSMEEAHHDDWPSTNTVIYRTGDDPQTIVDALFRL